MAAYTVTTNSGERGAHAKTLAASTVDSVTFDKDVARIEVLKHSGTGAIYFTTDGTTPTVGGANCEVIPDTSPAFRVVAAQTQSGNTVVKLISAGSNVVYSVTEAT